MLTFLSENPGSTSGEIRQHLHRGIPDIQEVLMSFEYRRYNSAIFDDDAPVCWSKCTPRWSSKATLAWYKRQGNYRNIVVHGERISPSHVYSRGKFSYLLSPYHSRTLSADAAGSRHHPGVANRDSQRMWFYRMRAANSLGEARKGRYIYFLTLQGMAAVEKYGV